MDLKIDLKQFVPKQMYMRNGVKHFLDPYRQMLVPLNQENLLLFKMEAYAVQVMGVPQSMIYTKQSFRKYGMDSSKLMDLVIHDTFNGELKPISIIECKSTSLKLCHTTTSHIEDFAKKNNVNYLIVTNGSEVDSYISREDRLSFWKIDNIPDYETIRKSYLSEGEVLAEPSVSSKRYAPKFSSKRTPKNIQPIVMNWVRALNNDTKKCSAFSFGGIQLVGDCGLRKKLIGFGSEKTANPLQRAFLIKDYIGNHQLVSIDLSSDELGAPILSVSIDDIDNRQVVVSMDLSSSIKVNEELACIKLDLNEYFKREESDFISDLKQLINERAPHLLEDQNLNFGCWDVSSKIDLNHEHFKEILIQLISFAILLDEHRFNQKQKDKNIRKL